VELVVIYKIWKGRQVNAVLLFVVSGYHVSVVGLRVVPYPETFITINYGIP